MPIGLFEIACVLVVGLTLAVMARRAPLGALFADYAALALAGYVGEDTCVRWYRFYSYAPAWHARIDEVPLLVPLIWPLVILSARSVADALVPRAGRWARASMVGALVIIDASLVEVVAVRAGLWSWAEPGHLGVPVVGIVGWGYFAFAADAISSSRARLRRVLVIVGAPLITHALILGSWWALFRWTMRGDLGDRSIAAVASLSLAATVWALRGRKRDRVMSLETAAPRMVAATLFFALLVTTAPFWKGGGDLRLWAHTLAVAVPYFAATRLGASSSRAARP